MNEQKGNRTIPEPCIKVYGQTLPSELQQKKTQVLSEKVAIFQVKCPVTGCLHCIHASELARTLIELDYHYYKNHKELL